MKKVIFYHLYYVNDARERFYKTYNKIVSSELIKEAKLNVCISVPPESQIQTDIISQEIGKLQNTHVFINDNTTMERDTLQRARNYAVEHPRSAILYLHSKGATRNGNQNVNAWVDYMEYFLIEHYNSCLDHLRAYDTAGVDYHTSPSPHYAGNFWWARGSYLKSRPEVSPQPESRIQDPRWYCEFWLLDGATATTRVSTLHQSGVDLYATEYKRKMYDER